MPLLRNCDFIAHLRLITEPTKTITIIDEDFLAAKARHPITELFLSRVDTIYRWSGNRTIELFFTTPSLMHAFTAAPQLRQAIYEVAKATKSRALMMPEDPTVFKIHHLDSWNSGDGKSCRDIKKTQMNWFDVNPGYPRAHEHLAAKGFNLRLYQKYFAPDLVMDRAVAYRSTIQGHGVVRFFPSPEQPLPIVVTLTSWPCKIKNAHIAIESLLRQTFRPNGVVLWLAEDDFSDRRIPETITDLMKRGLVIRWSKENLYSYLKLMPALLDSELRKCILVTADDDVVYLPNWLETLVQTHRKYPKNIVAHRARRIIYQDESASIFKSYNDWPIINSHEGIPSPYIFPTGVGGILYPPNSLQLTHLDISKALEICKTGDDIFFYAMARLKGTLFSIPDKPQIHPIDINDEESVAVSLWHLNQTGKNDAMIDAVFRHYGLYR